MYFVTFLLLLCTVFFGCTKLDETSTAVEASRKTPEQEAWDSIIITSNNGNKTAEIRFGYMYQYEKEKVFYFDEGIEVDIYNEQGLHVSRAVADSGVLKEDTEDIEAHGNVVAVSDSGKILKTERIFWSSEAQKWYSDAPTMYIPSEGDTVYSVGFESDRNFQNYQGYKLQFVSKSTIDLKIEDRIKPRTTDDDTSGIAKQDTSAIAAADTIKSGL